MTDTASHLVPEQGKLRRALAAVFAWLQAKQSEGTQGAARSLDCFVAALLATTIPSERRKL
jgi:hypothetical protein